MTKTIKKILSEFESYNISSIQPLPAITHKNVEEISHWPEPIKESPVEVEKSLEKKVQDEIDTIMQMKLEDLPKKKKEIIPPISPRKPFQLYLNKEIMVPDQAPISDPLFALSKKDAYNSQAKIHKTLVNNHKQWKTTDLEVTEKSEIIKKTKNLNNEKLALAEQALSPEIERYSKHKTLLYKIFDEYQNYIEHLEVEKNKEKSKLKKVEKTSEVLQAINLLQETEMKSIKLVDQAEKYKVEIPEPEVNIIREEIDPNYHDRTKNTIEIGLNLQQKIDYAKQLSDEIKSYRKWNPLLEEDLLLDERELIDHKTTIKLQNEDFENDADLKLLFDEIEKEVENLKS